MKKPGYPGFFLLDKYRLRPLYETRIIKKHRHSRMLVSGIQRLCSV